EPLQPNERGKGTRQQPARQRIERVAEAAAGNVQPVEGLAHQQEGAGVLRLPEEKGGAGGPPGWSSRASSMTAAGAATGPAAPGRTGVRVGATPMPADPLPEGDSSGGRLAVSTAAAAGAAGWARELTPSRPYFLRNLCRATRDTRTAKVCSM